MAVTDATFRAGGLASGLDTNSIIDQLVAIDSQPINVLKTRQGGLNAQISTIGDLLARMSSLTSAVKGLASGGALATTVQGTNTGFTAVSGSDATAGSYRVQVNTLAVAAQQRSAAFATTDTVRGGTLSLAMRGTTYNVAIGDGSALSDVALAIRNSGAPVSATVINDGTNNYLSLTARDTGFPLGGAAADALTVTENYTGTGNKALALASTQDAVNSRVTVDGLPIDRTSNAVSDVIGGVTLSLKATTTSAESLVVANDPTGTTTNITKMLDAYNSVLSVVQKQLAGTADTDRGSTLLGDSTLRGLQRAMQSLVTAQVGTGNVRALADIGVKSARDGSLSVDSATLSAAITRNPGAVNALFADATNGLAKLTQNLSDSYTNSVDGILITKRQGIQTTVKRMDDEIADMQLRVDARRDALVAQFTSMEQIVSSMKSVGSFLSSQGSGK